VAGTDKLAQASWSRLGEINRGWPKPFFPRMVAQATHCDSERVSISPKREGYRLSKIPRVLLLPSRALA